jgi:uncharacterized protein
MNAEEIRRRVTPVLARRGARRAILFGSHARGTADRRSDVDLIIVDDEDLRYLDRLDKYFADLSRALEAPVDIFVYSESELARMRERPFVRDALSEGVLLYERGKE